MGADEERMSLPRGYRMMGDEERTIPPDGLSNPVYRMIIDIDVDMIEEVKRTNPDGMEAFIRFQIEGFIEQAMLDITGKWPDGHS
jgi:hypothetical protein